MCCNFNTLFQFANHKKRKKNENKHNLKQLKGQLQYFKTKKIFFNNLYDKIQIMPSISTEYSFS